jgi:hypothetical protein
MKTINIRFTFTDTEWQRVKNLYTESEIRQILFEGAIGELDTLTSGRDQIGDDSE